MPAVVCAAGLQDIDVTPRLILVRLIVRYIGVVVVADIVGSGRVAVLPANSKERRPRGEGAAEKGRAGVDGGIL